MEYFDLYKKRMTRDGTTHQQRVVNFGRRECEKFLAQSPTRRLLTRADNGEQIECSLQTKTIKDGKNLKYVVCKHDTIFPLGTLLIDDEKNEFWLPFQREPHPFDVDNRYTAVLCEHFIKWVDEFGVVKSTPCYCVGSMDSKIKENFRTWNKMITPQPNKTLEILAPYLKIPKGTKMIINDEAWYLTDYDKTSAKGVMYMTLTESTINTSDDDLNNQIADANRIGEYELILPFNPIYVEPNKQTKILAVLHKKGAKINSELEIKNEYEEVVLVGQDITVSKEGNFVLPISYKRNAEVCANLKVICRNAAPLTDKKLVGDEVIKWGRTAEYKVYQYDSGSLVEKPFSFEIEGNENNLVTVNSTENSIALVANRNNKVGIVTLKVIVDDKILTKKIRISSLWS